MITKKHLSNPSVIVTILFNLSLPIGVIYIRYILYITDSGWDHAEVIFHSLIFGRILFAVLLSISALFILIHGIIKREVLKYILLLMSLFSSIIIATSFSLIIDIING